MLYALILLGLSSFSCEAALRVFVSTSLPEATLKTLYHDVQKGGGTLVIRGLIHNSFMETAKVFQKLGIEAQIDPEAFTKENISCIPTFILEDNKSKDKISGHVSLDYVLELFEKQGDASQEAKALLIKLRGQP